MKDTHAVENITIVSPRAFIFLNFNMYLNKFLKTTKIIILIPFQKTILKNNHSLHFKKQDVFLKNIKKIFLFSKIIFKTKIKII